MVTIFSDFTCPFCYLTEAALWRHEEAGRVAVRYRALELFPPGSELPLPSADAGWEKRIEPLADQLDLSVLSPSFRTRTGKAHEAAAFAAERGSELSMRQAVYTAYWNDHADIGRIDVLTELAEKIGFDPQELKIALDIDLHAAAVEADGTLAKKLRVPGAPTLYLGTGPEARILLGAQSASALDEALTRR
ncbi:DsbA family protein [soil metagenome]